MEEKRKKDFLNQKKTVFPAKTIKLGGLQTEISENSPSHSFLRLLSAHKVCFQAHSGADIYVSSEKIQRTKAAETELSIHQE